MALDEAVPSQAVANEVGLVGFLHVGGLAKDAVVGAEYDVVDQGHMSRAGSENVILRSYDRRLSVEAQLDEGGGVSKHSWFGLGE